MKDKEKILSFALLHLLLAVYSTGGIFSKKAASESFLSIKWIVLYFLLLLTLMIYAAGWQQILKRLPLGVAYVNKSVSLLWSMLWGAVIFNESISLQNIIGGVLVIAGVLMIVLNGEKNEQTD